MGGGEGVSLVPPRASSFATLVKDRLMKNPAYAPADEIGGVGGGGTPQKFGWGCAARRWKPLPYFRPKYVIFPAQFQTCPKISYPISDQTLTLFRLLRHLKTSLIPDDNQISPLRGRNLIKR